MIKMNKNQRKFFSSAVSHFGNKSTDVRLIELREFANDKGLIVPTSALKKYCQKEEQIRGHYDLTLTGFKIPPPPPLKDALKSFKTGNDEKGIIREMPVFASTNKKPKTKIKSLNEIKVKKPYCKNPVYLLIDNEHSTRSVHKTVSGAYDEIWGIFHSGSDKTLTEVEKMIKNKGISYMKSTNCGLWCYIIETELKL